MECFEAESYFFSGFYEIVFLCHKIHNTCAQRREVDEVNLVKNCVYRPCRNTSERPPVSNSYGHVSVLICIS